MPYNWAERSGSGGAVFQPLTLCVWDEDLWGLFTYLVRASPTYSFSNQRNTLAGIIWEPTLIISPIWAAKRDFFAPLRLRS